MSLTDTVTQLRDQVGIGVAVIHRPTGYGVDPCVHCDLTDPAPAVVTLSGTKCPPACLDCAPIVARDAIDRAPTAEAAARIRADVSDIAQPIVLSERDNEPGVIVVDADGARFRVEVVGVEVFVHDDKTARVVARFDMSDPAGRLAAMVIGSAIHEAVLSS